MASFLSRCLQLFGGKAEAVSGDDDAANKQAKAALAEDGFDSIMLKGNHEALAEKLRREGTAAAVGFRGAFKESLLHQAYLYHGQDSPNNLARVLLEAAPELVETVYEHPVYKGENVRAPTLPCTGDSDDL